MIAINQRRERDIKDIKVSLIEYEQRQGSDMSIGAHIHQYIMNNSRKCF